MIKLSQIPAPALAGVVRKRTTAEAVADVKNCRIGGADMLDLHLSCLDDRSENALRRIISASPLPVLALNYNNHADWSGCNFSEDERIDSFLAAIKAGAAGIDMQGYTFDARSKDGFFGEDKYSFTSGNPKEIVTDETVIAQQCELIERVHSMDAEVLLSCHPGKAMSAEQVVELALFLEKRSPDIIKIVTAARDESDLADGIRAMSLLKREVKTKVSYHLNGAAGAPSRLINAMLGSQIIFCVDGYDFASTMEQLDLRTVRSIIDNYKRII